MKQKETISITGEVKINIYKNNKIIETRETHNLITNDGYAHFANQLSYNSVESPIGYIAIGAGNSQTASDTTLDSELSRQALSDRYQGSGADDHKLVLTATFGEGAGTGTVTEAGIFNELSGGKMICYSDDFTAINKLSNMSIEIIWTITFGS